MESTRNTRYPGACDGHVHIYEDRFPLIPLYRACFARKRSITVAKYGGHSCIG